MIRTMSHIGEHSVIVEHAGSQRAIAMSDAELRERCHTAPLFIRRRMDANREARGLPPLWGSRAQGRRAAATVSQMRAFLAMTRARLSR